MEFWKENLLKAGTETNYDVFTVSLFRFIYHVLLWWLSVALMLTCSSRLTLKKIAYLGKVACKYIMVSQNAQCHHKEVTLRGTWYAIPSEYLNKRDED